MSFAGNDPNNQDEISKYDHETAEDRSLISETRKMMGLLDTTPIEDMRQPAFSQLLIDKWNEIKKEFAEEIE